MKHRIALAAAIAAVTLLAAPALAQTVPPARFPSPARPPSRCRPIWRRSTAASPRRPKPRARRPTPTTRRWARCWLALKGAGIDEKDVQTSRLSLQPQNAPNRTGPSAIVGYRASNRVTIRLRDVTKVASVIDTLVGAGANEIGGINFMVSQASKLLDEAREQAVADARRKAEIYAKAAGVTLGAPLSISEEGSPGPMPSARWPPAWPRQPRGAGRRDASVTVNVSWAIKPASNRSASQLIRGRVIAGVSQDADPASCVEAHQGLGSACCATCRDALNLHHLPRLQRHKLARAQSSLHPAPPPAR